MDDLDETVSVIHHDLNQCFIGIEQGDLHLLEVNKPRIDHYLSILPILLHQLEDDCERDSALQLMEGLQEVRTAIDSILEGNEEPDQKLSIPLTVEVVIYLRKLGMPWSKIGYAHGVSRQTMFNFRKKHGIQEPNRQVNDEELHHLITNLTSSNPKAGAVYMKGTLTAMGIRAPINRVKEVLREVNPCGTLLRRRERIYRREFKVKSANSLWCGDSNHKLISFRLVIHGLIDAYSRKIIYLNLSTNNLAETVLEMFLEGVEMHGLPKQVRGDRGVENVRVKDFMEETRCDVTKPYILGRSVHNTRIERLWRETNHHISYKYKAMFQHMEENGLLDENNEIDLLCLAFVFGPRIQEDLNRFVQTWNHHAMSTMGGRTPEQMWTMSMVMQQQLIFPNQESYIFDHVPNNNNDDENGDFEGLQNSSHTENIDSLGSPNHEHGDSVMENYSCSDNQYSAFDHHGSNIGDCPFGCPDHEHDYAQIHVNNDDNSDESPIIVPEYTLSNIEFLKSMLFTMVSNPLAEDGNSGINMYIYVRNQLAEVAGDDH